MQFIMYCVYIYIYIIFYIFIQEADDSDPENEDQYEILMENKKIEEEKSKKKILKNLKKILYGQEIKLPMTI